MARPRRQPMAPARLAELVEDTRAYLEPRLRDLGEHSLVLQQMCDEMIASGQLEAVIAFARDGESSADAALALLECEYALVGQPMPEALRAYALDRRHGRISFSRDRGRDWQSNVDRDLWIAVAVNRLVKIGLPPSRSKSTTAPSAASIVKDALDKSGLGHLDERSIARIYRSLVERLGFVRNK